MSNCFEKSSDERSNSSQFGVKGQLKVTGAILTKRRMEWEVDSEVEVMDNVEVEVMNNENEMNTEPTNALTIQGTTDCQPRAETQVQTERQRNLVHVDYGKEPANPTERREVENGGVVEDGVINCHRERSYARRQSDDGVLMTNDGKVVLSRVGKKTNYKD